jgi:hypothetical protein
MSRRLATPLLALLLVALVSASAQAEASLDEKLTLYLTDATPLRVGAVLGLTRSGCQ